MGNKKLNEQERLQAVADYAQCGNYTEVARRYGVTDTTIRRIVEKESDALEKVEHKKEEMAEDVLSHMQSQLPTVNLIIDKMLKRLCSDELIDKSSTSQLTTSLGTLIDKYTMVLKHNQGNAIEDDPITKALKEEAERMNNGDFS
jgi:transposase-like protein